MSLPSGDVCPPTPPMGGSSVVATKEEHISYVAFTAESGSVSKMAIVRRPLARVLGRYLLGDAIAAGGMATVHLGRLLGPAGFSRTVAVKRLHAELATDPELVLRFVDDARIASRVRHANVVQTLDVVAIEDELLLVREYIHGESFARLRRLASERQQPIPPGIAAGIAVGVLRGLHAAHEARSARGTPLALVHGDVSPQNIMVGADGIARVLDFGITDRRKTCAREVERKLAYLAPEQLSGEDFDRRADVFAVGVVLWEALAGERLFRCDDETSTMEAIYHREAPRLSLRGLGMDGEVDDVLARALAKDAGGRFETADAMARALGTALTPASDREIGDWVQATAAASLAQCLEQVAAFESDDTGVSTARRFAGMPAQSYAPAVLAAPEANELQTWRRDALMPPPLPRPPEGAREGEARESVRALSVTSENETLRKPIGTMPTLEREARAAFANAPAPSVPLEGASNVRAIHTPLVMIAACAGGESVDPGATARESGHTRIDPIERRARPRTSLPIPFPLPLVAPESLAKAKRRASVFQIALLVFVPPFLVAAALAGVRTERRAVAVGAEQHSTATSPTTPSAAVTAPPVAAPLSDNSPSAGSASSATPTATARPATTTSPANSNRADKKARRHFVRPQLAHPVLPVAVNR